MSATALRWFGWVLSDALGLRAMGHPTTCSKRLGGRSPCPLIGCNCLYLKQNWLGAWRAGDRCTSTHVALYLPR